jgi:hypothetical protein
MSRKAWNYSGVEQAQPVAAADVQAELGAEALGVQRPALAERDVPAEPAEGR